MPRKKPKPPPFLAFAVNGNSEEIRMSKTEFARRILGGSLDVQKPMTVYNGDEPWLKIRPAKRKR